MTFEGLPVLGIGQSGVLLLVVLMVLTDKLVWHKRLRVLEKRIETVEAERAELTKQNTMLLDSAIPTVNAVLGALHQAAEPS